MTPALCMVLHAHLPFVPHHEGTPRPQEMWLPVAAAGAYLPLLEVLERLSHDGLRAHFTLAISPSLMAMLDMRPHRDLIEDHIHDRIDQLRQEARYTRSRDLAALYEYEAGRLRALARRFRHIDRDLVGAFARHAEAGHVDMIVSAGAHGLLPLMATGELRRLSVQIALEAFEARVGFPSEGVWLPECAYSDEADAALAACQVEWSIIAPAGLRGARPRAALQSMGPLVSPRGVVYYPATSSEAFGAEGLRYTEHRAFLDSDRGLSPMVARGLTASVGAGLRGGAVASATDGHSRLYRPADADAAARQRAAHFVSHRADEAERKRASAAEHYDAAGRAPVQVSAHRAEFFGVNWAEGPVFLEHVVRSVAEERELGLRLRTLAEELDRAPRCQLASPAASTWGAGGGFRQWVDRPNHWVYRHLHRVEERFVQLNSSRRRDDDRRRPLQGRLRRALRRALAEVLLAGTSDWAWIMGAGDGVAYAVERTERHVGHASELLSQIEDGRVDLDVVDALQARHPIFAGVGPEGLARG